MLLDQIVKRLFGISMKKMLLGSEEPRDLTQRENPELGGPQVKTEDLISLSLDDRIKRLRDLIIDEDPKFREEFNNTLEIIEGDELSIYYGVMTYLDGEYCSTIVNKFIEENKVSPKPRKRVEPETRNRLLRDFREHCERYKVTIAGDPYRERIILECYESPIQEYLDRQLTLLSKTYGDLSSRKLKLKRSHRVAPNNSGNRHNEHSRHKNVNHHTHIPNHTKSGVKYVGLALSLYEIIKYSEVAEVSPDKDLLAKLQSNLRDKLIIYILERKSSLRRDYLLLKEEWGNDDLWPENSPRLSSRKTAIELDLSELTKVAEAVELYGMASSFKKLYGDLQTLASSSSD